MSRYAVSVGLGLATLYFTMHIVPPENLSKKTIYIVLLSMLAVCFIVGKIWPDLFTSKRENTTGDINQSSHNNDVEYWAKYPTFMKILTVVVVILVIISNTGK